MVGDVDPTGLATVYHRPPKAYLDDDTILTVLRHRLRGTQVASAPATPAAR
jgi:hypothetical protein